MIQIVSGVYGHYINGRVVPKDKNSEPFSLTAEQEARLVEQGIAKFVNETAAPVPVDPAPDGDTDDTDGDLPEGVTGIPEYSVESSVKDLREIGKLCGLTFKVGTTKEEMVAALDKHIAENTVEDGEDSEDEASTEDDAPSFDAADAVVE